MSVAMIRRISSLAAVFLIVSCTPQQGAGPEPVPSARTITFHNSGRDRIQVYLVGAKESWLLGRLEPQETARLRLPESATTEDEQSVVLAVLPGWSRSLAPRADRRAVLSILEPGRAMSGEEWMFVNGQLQGPRQRP